MIYVKIMRLFFNFAFFYLILYCNNSASAIFVIYLYISANRSREIYYYLQKMLIVLKGSFTNKLGLSLT